jgi:hypothetical protein
MADKPRKPPAAKGRSRAKPAAKPASKASAKKKRKAASSKRVRAARPGKKPARSARRPAAAPEPGGPRAGNGEGAMDPAGFFVARVRGEEAVREAPHPMAADRAQEAGAGAAPPADERLGELPRSYDEDTLVLLPRDPTSLFAYWDQSERTLRESFRDLAQPRAELWLWARAGDGWERVRTVELALESRGWYLHGLAPGRSYRAELRAVDDEGRQRAVGPGSGEVALPPAGPSLIVDDRLIRLPWEEALGPALGPGWRAPDLPQEARDALARLSSGPPGEGPTSGAPPPPGGGGARP